MPRIATDKTIQVSSELHERIRKLANKEADSLGLPSMSMATYLSRLLDKHKL